MKLLILVEEFFLASDDLVQWGVFVGVEGALLSEIWREGVVEVEGILVGCEIRLVVNVLRPRP